MGGSITSRPRFANVFAICATVSASDSPRLPVVSYPEHQAAAIGMIGGGNQVLHETILVLRETHFPIQFVELVRYGYETLLQAPLRGLDPVLLSM